MKRVDPGLATAFSVAELGFEAPLSRARLDQIASESAGYRQRWAKRLIALHEQGTVFETSYPYPVQVWRLGRKQMWVALGGEVVVDYPLRLKKKYGSRTWVTGYANDVMAYIPSARIQREGGYESSSMDVYGLPGTGWARDVEERIIAAVDALETPSASSPRHPGGSARRSLRHFLVPADGAAFTVGRDGHPAGHRGTEADLERAVRLLAAAHAVEEVLHVSDRRVDAADDVGRLVGCAPPARLDLRGLALGQEGHLRRPRCGESSLVAQQEVVAFAEVVVPEHRIPGEQEFPPLLHGYVHDVRHLHLRRQVVRAGHGDAGRDLQVQDLAPEADLVDHVLVDVPAGVVPVETAS